MGPAPLIFLRSFAILAWQNELADMLNWTVAHVTDTHAELRRLNGGDS